MPAMMAAVALGFARCGGDGGDGGGARTPNFCLGIKLKKFAIQHEYRR